MAKKQEVAQQEPVQSALPTQDDGGWGEYQGPKGTDEMKSEDVNIPRLKMLQQLSPEVRDKLGTEGDLMHSITKQVLCPVNERLPFIPVCFDKQYLLWKDRNDGGGIMARATKVVLPSGEVRYQWDKQNTTFQHKLGQARIAVEWTTGRFVEDNGLTEFGSSIPGQADSGPAATLHYNYVIMLPTFGYQMVAISLSRTAAKKARDLNSLVKMGPAPIWARVLECTAIKEQKDRNEWYNWMFQPKELLKPTDPLVAQLQQLNDELRKKGINVDFSDGGDDAGHDASGNGERPSGRM